jgi:quercetin dioxygenase-like cupin family protein
LKLVSTRDVETRRAPAEWFTGAVWIGGSPADSSPDAGIFRVFFGPGTRTNWHTHPEGQILYVLYVVTGAGRAQREGEPAVEMSPGDVVYFAPGEKHWHGARPDTSMSHVAVSPANTTGGGTEWMGPVTNEEYLGRTD